MRKMSFVDIALLLFLLAGCAHFEDQRDPASHDKGQSGSLKPHKNQQASAPESVWVEYGPGGQAVVRAIVDASADCPDLMADGQNLAMLTRSTATADGRFPNAVCEKEIPAGTHSVTLQGKSLPLISKTPNKILILGDTGCRVKGQASGKVQVQDCNDPKKGWPFAELAQAAAQQKPDLVIHVGDYHYRESACPPGNAECANSPFGDTWASWNADFFTPVGSLLKVAPWIFVRGNHEICLRAQEGFFRFLDPRPLTTTCVETTPPYLVSLPGINFAVLDTAQANPTAQSVGTLSSLPASNTVLVTHRPLWISNEEAAKGDDDGDNDEADSSTSSQLAAVGVPTNVAMVFTGHRHLFRASSFADHRPIQITAGNGGTKLEGHPSQDAPGTVVDASSTTLSYVSTLVNFGFVILEKQADASWVMNLYDKKGAGTGSCRISALTTPPANRAIACNIVGANVPAKKKKKKQQQ